MSPAPLRLTVVRHLSGDEVSELATLLADVGEADGVAPLSEHVWLHLRHGGDVASRHVLARRGADAVGYAHLDVTDPVAGASAELAVRPSARHHGVGDALVRAVLAEAADAAPGRPLRLWAHGEHAAAAPLAERHGFVRGRVLWQLRRSLLAPLPRAELPLDVKVRTFQVGVDEAAWTAVNNRAFPHHPEQGRWSVEEVRLREAEPWFDPAGFFLAERVEDAGPRLLGFHWTKVHGGQHDGHDPVGEVYVVGVDPDARGLGLGRALTLLGLAHLRRLGLQQAMLYVDEDNAPAIALYERLGFVHWDRDVLFRHG